MSNPCEHAGARKQGSWCIVPDTATGEKIGSKPCEGPEDRKPDHRGEKARDDRVRLEIAPVEHLGRKDRPAEGRLEDRADPGPDAGGDRDAPLLLGKPEIVGDDRSEAGRDLGGRPLPARASAGGDGDDRRDRLGQGYAAPDPPVAVIRLVAATVPARSA